MRMFKESYIRQKYPWFFELKFGNQVNANDGRKLVNLINGESIAPEEIRNGQRCVAFMIGERRISLAYDPKQFN